MVDVATLGPESYSERFTALNEELKRIAVRRAGRRRNPTQKDDDARQEAILTEIVIIIKGIFDQEPLDPTAENKVIGLLQKITLAPREEIWQRCAAMYATEWRQLQISPAVNTPDRLAEMSYAEFLTQKDSEYQAVTFKTGMQPPEKVAVWEVTRLEVVGMIKEMIARQPNLEESFFKELDELLIAYCPHVGRDLIWKDLAFFYIQEVKHLNVAVTSRVFVSQVQAVRDDLYIRFVDAYPLGTELL